MKYYRPGQHLLLEPEITEIILEVFNQDLLYFVVL